MTQPLTASAIFHPEYSNKSDEWNKWRKVYDGGNSFIDEYLVKYSNREDNADFINRKKITPTPNFAKAAINDVKNSIYQRLTDVERRGGSTTYSKAVRGENFGVDLKGSSMNAFIGMKVLGELLLMGRVGIFVDMPPNSGGSMRDAIGLQPYLYVYRVEDIQSWTVRPGTPDEFTSVLLRDHVEVVHGQFNLPSSTKTRLRHIFIGDDGFVHIRFFERQITDTDHGKEESDVQVDINGNRTNEDVILEIKHIPFVMPELSDSLMADIANHQIALLNMESSDVGYSLQSNFPFYIEQSNDYDPSHIMPQDSGGDGTAANSSKAKDKIITTGAAQGRKYPKGADAPSFIHPSSEPLEASMKKQAGLKNDIRALINLSLSNIQGKVASAESKKLDDRGLEAGLSSIGLVLEHAERQIATYWHLLEDNKTSWSVKYPEKWSLKSDADRRDDAKSLRELRDTIPSALFQRSISKEIAILTLGSKITDEDLDKIHDEIDNAKSYTADPETIFRLIELGVLDLELAAEILGLPKDTVEKAAKQHADRLARIAESQSKASGLNAGSARGVDDLDDNPGQSGKLEKQQSRDSTTDSDPTKSVRGDGRDDASL